MPEQKLTEEKGIIKYIHGKRVTIEIVKRSSNDCKSCGVCVGIENNPSLVELDFVPGLRVGQQVTLKSSDFSRYKSMLFIFVLPIVSLLVGSFIAQNFHFIFPNAHNLRMICSGSLCFITTIVAVSIYEKKNKRKRQPYRKIIAKTEILDNFHQVS